MESRTNLIEQRRIDDTFTLNKKSKKSEGTSFGDVKINNLSTTMISKADI